MSKQVLFDVVAVNLGTLKVRLLAEAKKETTAEKIVEMAVSRRGVEIEFFSEVPAGTYKDGEKWEGDKCK